MVYKERYLEITTDKNIAVIGDIHGCFFEFKNLVEKLISEYKDNILIISVGDTIDRGDYNLDTLKYTFSLFKRGIYLEVKSNHNEKLYKWFLGRNITISYGLEKTINEIKKLPEAEFNKLKEEYLDYYSNLPLYIVVNKKVVVAHAGILDRYIGRTDKKVKSFVLYGKTTGKFTPEGFPERVDWTKERVVNENSPKIVYGHVVFEEPYINNLCYGIDTGCVLGNKLTAYLPFEDRFIFEKAKRQYFSFD